MAGFRGSDAALAREIAQVERIAGLRLRRATAEMRALAAELRELKRERARRRGGAPTPASADSPIQATA